MVRVGAAEGASAVIALARGRDRILGERGGPLPELGDRKPHRKITAALRGDARRREPSEEGPRGGIRRKSMHRAWECLGA